MNDITRARACNYLRRIAPGEAEKMEPLFKILDWEWTGMTPEEGPPTKEDILKTLNHFIDEIEKGVTDSLYSGGLGVSINDPFNDGDILNIEISFKYSRCGCMETKTGSILGNDFKYDIP